jgi:anti-sigma factor RsiW
MRFLRRNGADKAEHAELTALADGSLVPERRAALENEVAASPELAAALDEQQRGPALLRQANLEVEAPPALRARVEAQRRSRRSIRVRPLALGVGVAVAAAAALVLVLTLPSNVGGPTLAEAAALGTMPSTVAAPPPQPGEPKLLARAVEGVPFPNWLEKFGWKATGVRVDEIRGRPMTTVFYEKGGRRIAYTIVAGKPPDVPENAGQARREGVYVRVTSVNGRPVVAWLRKGHLCILSGAGVEPGVLVKLAAWRGKGSVPV